MLEAKECINVRMTFWWGTICTVQTRVDIIYSTIDDSALEGKLV